MGSVKDLLVIEQPSKSKPGKARFAFSDRYSVFDWGEMPDHVLAKGAATCITTAYFFEKLEQSGIKTHYRGLVEGDEIKRLDNLNSPQSQMEVTLLQVLKPRISGDTYDYSRYKEGNVNILVPLEIIYRNSLPEGSSVFQRLKEGSLSLVDLNLAKKPYPGQHLEKPFLDVSTKLESRDRYISWDEAKELAGLSEDEHEEIKRITLHTNELITREARSAGLRNEDGKIEFGFDESRNLMLVDAVGTLDESRFTYEGMPVSKELVRIFYRNTKWLDAVEAAKGTNKVRWKDLVAIRPPALNPALKAAVSMLYKACCNEMTHRIWFDDAPTVKEVLEELKGVVSV